MKVIFVICFQQNFPINFCKKKCYVLTSLIRMFTECLQNVVCEKHTVLMPQFHFVYPIYKVLGMMKTLYLTKVCSKLTLEKEIFSFLPQSQNLTQLFDFFSHHTTCHKKLVPGCLILFLAFAHVTSKLVMNSTFSGGTLAKQTLVPFKFCSSSSLTWLLFKLG